MSPYDFQTISRCNEQPFRLHPGRDAEPARSEETTAHSARPKAGPGPVSGAGPQRNEGPGQDQSMAPGEAGNPRRRKLAFRPARKQAIHRFERDYLNWLWPEARGNLSAAARIAGIDRKYLRDLLRKHGLY
jgi:DNA-binding NtrC family response regulator